MGRAGARRRREIEPALPLGLAAAGALVAALFVPFPVAAVDKLSYDLDVVRAESELYDRLPPIVADAGGARVLLRCGPVYAPPFEVQAVAWAMHVHSSQVGIFASPPGTVLAGHFSALGHDPRFPEINKNRRWFVGRNCNGAESP